jgi:RNA polymerase sigma-70 factor (ECF subfamily)
VNATGIDYLNGLYCYAIVLTQNQIEAENLVEQTYARVAPAIAHLTDGNSAKALYSEVLRNTWLHQFKKRPPDSRVPQTDGQDCQAVDWVEICKDSHDADTDKTDETRMREAIMKLTAEFREIIVLREFEDLSYREIAEIVDCSKGTVVSRVAIARSSLRALLS